MSRTILAPRGTQDLVGERAYRWYQIREAIRKVAENYGLLEMITPTFEYTELFCRSVGECTDVVQKEMYTFEDKGGRSLTLRPEGTAGAVRACVEHNLLHGVLPLKLFYFANCFRYDKPQAGRFRELNQFGVEIFGSDSAKTDAETIGLALRVFEEFGVASNLKLLINSIGCKGCRGNYLKALLEYLEGHKDDYCKVCRGRMGANPLRVLDCKEEKCTALNKGAPKITEFICAECGKAFKKLKNLLALNGIAYEVDDQLVRGLDYYNRTVFEFVMQKPGGGSFAVCGGGRYDGLVESLGGPPTPAFGFGVGLERLLLLLEEQEYAFRPLRKCDVFIVGVGQESEKSEEIAQKLLKSLRQQNMFAECDTLNRSVKAQFRYADKIGARFCVVLGEEECQSEVLVVKNMQNSQEERVPKSEVLNYLSARLKKKDA